MQAAVYCRVSTSGQAENGTSLESQRDACIKLAEDRGYQVLPENIFLEDWTGADLDRPKLERARELVRSKAVQAIICYAVDRLARNPIHVGLLAEELEKREAELLFVLEPLDSSPEGSLIRYVKGYAAQIERERIKERTMRGKRSRARQGFMVQATGKGIYGYRYVPEAKKRVIYEPEAQVVRRLFQDCAAGQSCYSIATNLNQEGIPTLGGGLWHPLTIKRILTNPAFKGITIFGRTRRVALPGNRHRIEERNPDDWIEIPDATPPIVTEGLFDHVQEVLSRPKRNPNLSSNKYLLTSYIECICGAPVVGTCLNKTYRYYRCRSTWPTTTRPKTCGEGYMRAGRLEDEVWKVVQEVLRQPEVVIQELERQQGGILLLEEEMARLRTSARRLADQEKRLIRLYGMGEITEEYLLREANQVKKTREAQEKDLARLQQQREHLRTLDGLGERVRAFCDRVGHRLGQFDFEEKRLALQALQIKIVAGKEGARLLGAIPTNLATIEQTSALPRGCTLRNRWA